MSAEEWEFRKQELELKNQELEFQKQKEEKEEERRKEELQMQREMRQQEEERRRRKTSGVIKRTTFVRWSYRGRELKMKRKGSGKSPWRDKVVFTGRH